MEIRDSQAYLQLQDALLNAGTRGAEQNPYDIALTEYADACVREREERDIVRDYEGPITDGMISAVRQVAARREALGDLLVKLGAPGSLVESLALEAGLKLRG